MKLTQEMKRRILIFGGGAMIGAILSVFLLSFALKNIAQKEPTRYPVVLSTCNLKAGDVVKESCTLVKNVAEQLLPPNVLMADDLSWHIGHKLINGVEKGSVFRSVDFEPITSEGYIR